MKRHIHFKHYSHLLQKSDCLDCSEHIFKTAVMCQEHKDLRFDNATGVIRDNHLGELERYSKQSDFVPHTTIDEVMQWEFKRHVNNSISRLLRDLTA